MKLTDKQIAEYFHRSFSAIDGFWFLKVEEKFGFETALEIDRAVWDVFPKIQAREMRAMLDLEKNADALRIALVTAMDLREFSYDVASEGSGFKIIISRCPWHDAMVKSGRKHLSVRIGDTICPAEYSAWVKEFGETLRFSFESKNRLCNGASTCIMCFKEQENSA